MVVGIVKLRQSSIGLFLGVALLGQQTEAPIEPEPPAPTEYGGPAILSRGATASLRAPSESIRFRPYISLTGAYDTGITPVSLTSAGQVPNDASAGVEAEAGVYGFHRWKTATLGIDYRGNYRHYTRNTYYNGTDQVLSLVYKKSATRRVGYTLRESAGIVSRTLFSGGGVEFIDPQFGNTPNNELFDGRTLYLDTMADVTYQKTARLSFNFGGNGFLTRRRSSALYGVTGYRARGDMAYRTSRNATSGVAYDFTHFEFTKGFGGSDIHTVQLVQSFRLGRYWELAMKAGGSRVETLGLAQVAIDPVIAVILGRSTGVEAVHRVNWSPAADVRLTRGFRHASMWFSYARGVSSGNGLFLTSRSESTTFNFTYTGTRKWNVGLSAGYISFAGLLQDLGKVATFYGGTGATYNLTRSFHVITRYDYRRVDVRQSTLRRDIYRASIGFGFSPGDVPLSLW